MLSDPESLKQLGELAQMLGLSPDAPAPEAPTQDKSARPPEGMPDIAAMAELMGKLRQAGADDDNIRFLMALRPLLSEEKHGRLDRAVKILKAINLLPVLKESGILGGDLLGIL